MSAAARFGNTVYGNLAYDLTNPENFTDFPQYEEREVALPRVDEQEHVSVHTRTRPAVSVAAVLGFGVAAVVLVFSLLGRVQLMQTSDEAVALSNRLAALEEEQSRLLIEYESTFDLTEIEEYARNTLGMQKVRGDQIYYVGSTVPDKAVVIAENSRTGLAGRVYDLLEEIGELFR